MLSPIENFEIKPLDIENLPKQLFIFMKKCDDQGMKNNISVEAMKFGKWDNDAWWCTWVDNRIVSICGAHRWNEFEPDCWRLMVRTATLKEFRGKAPGNYRQIKNDFNWGFILPYQIEHAKKNGAKKIVFTTNSDSLGDANSLRTNRAVANVLEPQGLVSLIQKDADVFHTKQNIWEIHP